jgi:hypothetical protein
MWRRPPTFSRLKAGRARLYLAPQRARRAHDHLRCRFFVMLLTSPAPRPLSRNAFAQPTTYGWPRRGRRKVLSYSPRFDGRALPAARRPRLPALYHRLRPASQPPLQPVNTARGAGGGDIRRQRPGCVGREPGSAPRLGQRRSALPGIVWLGFPAHGQSFRQVAAGGAGPVQPATRTMIGCLGAVPVNECAQG